MVVVTMRGRWTIKRKEKEKEKDGEGGRRRRRRRKGPLEKRLGGPRVSLYIPSRVFRRGIKFDAERLSGGDWGLDWGRTGSDFPPSGTQFINPLPRACETPKGNGPNSHLRPLRSSPFTFFHPRLVPFSSLSMEAKRSSMLRAGSKT